LPKADLRIKGLSLLHLGWLLAWDAKPCDFKSSASSDQFMHDQGFISAIDAGPLCRNAVVLGLSQSSKAIERKRLISVVELRS